MSLLFIDSFDHYATADLAKKYETVGGSPAINSTAGRRSSGGVEFDTGGEYVRKSISGTPAILIVGMAVKVSALTVAQDVLKFMDAASIQTTIRIRTDGKLEALQAGSVSLGISAAAAFVANTYAYLEVKITINDATGAVDARVNAVQHLNLTSQDTKNTANAYTDGVQIGGDGTAIVTVDDCYILDTTGSAPQNAMLGDVRVDVAAPTGDGLYAQFAPSTGSTRFPNVDDAAPDGDATYNSSSAVGNRDSFTMAPVLDIGGATIYGVQLNMLARKDSTGTRKVRGLARPVGSNYFGTSQSLTTSYINYREIWQINPETGLPWAEAELNASQFGYEVAS